MAAYFSKFRTIIEAINVSAAVDAARSQFDRFDDAWDGLNWILSRRPESLGVAPNKGDGGIRLYVQDGDPEFGSPQIWVIYRVSEESVELLAINFTIPPSESDGDT